MVKQIIVLTLKIMTTENLKKQLKTAKRELLEEKHDAELKIKLNKKELRKTKRKLKEVDELLRQI